MFKHLLKINKKFGAQNYKSAPVIIREGWNVYLKDIDGKQYFDFLSSYSSVNQGHCHPQLVKTMKEQCEKLTLCSRAFHNENLIEFYEFMNSKFNYDKCLPMNTGVEAGETAIKLARLWGYKEKKINNNEAQIVVANNNFWGRTITACSSSSDPLCYNNFGPYTPGFISVQYNNIPHLEHVFKNNPNIAAFMVEPIQGEAGIIIPDSNYLSNVSKLCKKYNILLICDEIQTGIGRTGCMLASDYFNIKPDILLLGKALSGGMIPISAVLANDNIMNLIKPGSHGSTFGGNPLATKIAIEAVKIIKTENLTYNAEKMGNLFRKRLTPFKNRYVKDVRGVGLLNAIEFLDPIQAQEFVNNCRDNGLLTNVTKNATVRMCPPLIISKHQMETSLDIIEDQILNLYSNSKYYF